jgi:hypothetical protein
VSQKYYSRKQLSTYLRYLIYPSLFQLLVKNNNGLLTSRAYEERSFRGGWYVMRACVRACLSYALLSSRLAAGWGAYNAQYIELTAKLAIQALHTYLSTN